jgi:hypothetical protein
VTWTERLRKGTEGTEREVKGTWRKANSAKGRGQEFGELDPMIPPPPPHTKWGCKEDLGKRGGGKKGVIFHPFPAYGEGGEGAGFIGASAYN